MGDDSLPFVADTINPTDALRRSFLRITRREDLDRLPYGSIIVANAVDFPGIFTLIKIDQGDWRTFVVWGDPESAYGIGEEDGFMPDIPALLICCGDQLPEPPEVKRKFTLIKGGAEEEQKPDSQ